jgi:hypothetical protein
MYIEVYDRVVSILFDSKSTHNIPANSRKTIRSIGLTGLREPRFFMGDFSNGLPVPCGTSIPL